MGCRLRSPVLDSWEEQVGEKFLCSSSLSTVSLSGRAFLARFGGDICRVLGGPRTGLANFFCKEPDRTCFLLLGLYGFCPSTQLLRSTRAAQVIAQERAQLCSSGSFFRGITFQFHRTFCSFYFSLQATTVQIPCHPHQSFKKFNFFKLKTEIVHT